ncbi:MAG TPA: hypothetical protein VMB02_14410 [Candidatus Aquilonibacter sp.]|nr:hypothetical protein [Candidatus Aquilonibacter sp.]
MPDANWLDPRAEYARRLEIHGAKAAQTERLHIRLGNAKLAVVAGAIVLLWLCWVRHLASAYWLFVPAGVLVALFVVHELTIRRKDRAERAATYYRAGIARMEDRWTGTGAAGDRFRDPKHVYADDLDLFGQGGLFELLSTARTPMGENRLAAWLCSPSPLPAVGERQGLVAELREKLDLRENVALTGEELRARLNPESLTKWAEDEAMLGGPALRLGAAACALVAGGTFVYYLWTMNYWPFLVVLFLELLIFQQLRKRALAIISEVSCNSEGVQLFASILGLIERENFSSPRLREMTAELRRGPEAASHAVRKFGKIVNWIDGRGSLIVKIIDRPLLYVVQTGLAADAWRKRYGHRMRAWIEIAGEVEALLSLASYAFEHPADPFPEFIAQADPQAVFAGEDLGHPLMPSSRCVRNTVQLDGGVRVLLVSGSNMSGKSTLLRTVGINAVLALAGAPIRGKSLRLAPLSLGTRLRSTDSLLEGRSTFYTEVLRIRQVLDLSGGERPVLFLFDELLDGTNSHDRQIGAQGLVRAFLERGAIGMVTTHDLALTEMANSVGACIRNVHFEDRVEDGQMRFDYKLRDGVVTKSNALELMRLAGLEV